MLEQPEIDEGDLVCPMCGGRRTEDDVRDQRCCLGCRIGKGTFGVLAAKFRTDSLELNSFPDGPAIRHFACKLFSLAEFDGIALKRLEDWLQAEYHKNREQMRAMQTSEVVAMLRAACESTPTAGLPAPVADKTERRGKRASAKRSWTQNDLDEAIREYKAKRASTYNDLVDGVKRGSPGATKSARELFGRNAIVRALGVKSRAMVSNSAVWQELADKLGLRGRTKKSRHARGHRIGMGIALDKQAVAAGGTAVDQAIRRETIDLVTKAMPEAEAEATIEKLQRGDITDDQARELVEEFAEQQQDDRTRKIRQNL